MQSFVLPVSSCSTIGKLIFFMPSRHIVIAKMESGDPCSIHHKHTAHFDCNVICICRGQQSNCLKSHTPAETRSPSSFFVEIGLVMLIKFTIKTQHT